MIHYGRGWELGNQHTGRGCAASFRLTHPLDDILRTVDSFESCEFGVLEDGVQDGVCSTLLHVGWDAADSARVSPQHQVVPPSLKVLDGVHMAALMNLVGWCLRFLPL